MTIWRKLVLAGCLGVAAMPVVAQRHDPYVVEKLQEQEKHLDHTDANITENAKSILALREQIEAYKDYALGFAGCFTLFMGILKYLGRKGEQSA